MENRKGLYKGISMGIAGTLVVILLFNFLINYTMLSSILNRNMNVSNKIHYIESILDSHYIDSYNKNEIQEDMYKGLVAGLGDKYSTYMSKKTFAQFTAETEGSYAGIGTVISVDDTDNSVLVITAYEGSPSAKAGIVAGDKILAIDGTKITGSKLDDVSNMMKGKEGTVVTLTILSKDGTKKDVKVVRGQITIPTVSYKMLDNQNGYIKISQFDRVTLDQFNNAYDDLTKQNMKALVIDLRNNPGGLLDVVSKIGGRLIPKGFVTYTEEKNGKKTYYNSDETQIKIPLAILVNGNSASASEVLAGAVQATNVGVLVGEQTFGKGIVQNIYKLPDGSAVKTTIAKYYTPKGICINGEGLTPDDVVPMDEKLAAKISELTPEQDVQLKKAIEIVDTQKK